ncbi:PspA-associated protein PspAB [Allostreptomyces psammosilenae]|uniref:Uncharacterized protein n=1 Tax=Allostreptomyces psammosilenae TaxID=1892865 RepID=A0A853A9C2_9ACTN|nr:hypothetical protein [Allostreptomyces psammosilenae]NYI07012.1 hypothetical protein [Allostreptomyces psammosilenae]
MGWLDVLLGRSKPARPDLDQLFGLPSAAVTLEAALGMRATGLGSVAYASTEGAAFLQVQQDLRALLDADVGPAGGLPVEISRDDYGYTWLLLRQEPGSEGLPALVNDVHAVNTALQDGGFGPHLLCSLVGFTDDSGRRLALVYLYKRGTFYPFAPLPAPTHRRDNALELQVRSLITDDLRLEDDLTRWFPLWGAPGL